MISSSTMDSANNEDRFRARLDNMEWPAIFPFKFIVPADKYNQVMTLFENLETTTRFSRKGNYVSVTATPFMLNPDKVIEKYKEAAEIDGLIAL